MNKATKISLKFFLVVISIFMTVGISFSQGTDSRTLLSRQKVFYLAVNLNPMEAGISNNSSEIFEGIEITPKLSFGASLEAGYFFTPFLGISMGVGYNSWTQEIGLKKYETNYSTTDSEDEFYEMRVAGNTIKEIQTYNVLICPVSLIMRIQFTEKLGLFLQPGINVGIPLNTTYNSSGIFSYSGYYPAYPVLLENIPEYGFPRDLSTSVSEPIFTKSLWTAINLSGGVTRSMGNNIDIGLQVNYYRSNGDIIEKPVINDIKISSQANELRSFSEFSTVSGASGYGVVFSIRYFIK